MPEKVNIRQCVGACQCHEELNDDLDVSNHAKMKQLYK